MQLTPVHYVKPLAKFSASEVLVFPMKFVSNEAQTVTALLPFWIVLGTQVTFSWHHSTQGTNLFTTSLGYGYSWAILFQTKRAPNPKNDTSEDSVKDLFICWKSTFCWPLKGCQFRCKFFCILPILRLMEWCHINTAWLPSTVSKRQGRIQDFEMGGEFS